MKSISRLGAHCTVVALLAILMVTSIAAGQAAAANLDAELASLRSQLSAAEARGAAGRNEAEQLRARIQTLEAQRSANRDQTIQLNVFQVTEDRDDSYRALNSNSITRFNLN